MREFEIEFDEKKTDIRGENGTGKTTILDSIYWLFFDKNSKGSKKFDLFPLDSKNELIENTQPCIELDMDVDGEPVNLRKTKSTSTAYFINEIPKKANEFNAYIESLVSENLFMTLVNPVFFGDKYKWDEQKSIILDKFEVVDTVLELPKYDRIRFDITAHRVDDIKSKYNAQRKDLEKAIIKDNGTKEYIASNMKHQKVDATKEELIRQKEVISKQLSEYEKSFSKTYELKDQLFKLKSKIQQSNDIHNSALSEKRSLMNQKKIDKSNMVKEYQKLSNDLKMIEDKCSLCGNKLDAGKIQNQKDEINSKIESTIKKGKILATEIDTLEVELNRLSAARNNDPLEKEKEELEKEISSIEANVNIDKINLFKSKISEIDGVISSYDTLSKLNKDLKDVSERISKNTIALGEVELKIALLKDYHRDYSELVATELNSKLDNIQIKTFSVQKNGEVKETFEITMNGVPYSSLNSAGKIIAGVEIIQLIKDGLDVNFPIIIDNKESITRDFLIDNQIITLSVAKGESLGV